MITPSFQNIISVHLCYLDQEIAVLHLKSNVFDGVSMLNQVSSHFCGEMHTFTEFLFFKYNIRFSDWRMANLPSFPGFSGDSNTNSICEQRGVVIIMGRINYSLLYCTFKDLYLNQSTGRLIYRPYLVWWHGTPPVCFQSLNPCRPKARSPSYHSRRRLPAKWSHWLGWNEPDRTTEWDTCISSCSLGPIIS